MIAAPVVILTSLTATQPSSAVAPALDGKQCPTWCKIPNTKGVYAGALLLKNDHHPQVLKAVGRIKIQNRGSKDAYVSYRPSGSAYGVGRVWWTNGPSIGPGGQSTYFWDYFYRVFPQPYAFEFRICVEKRGLDSCGGKLKIDDPPSPRY